MSVVRDRSESGAWPLTTSGVTFGLSPRSSEIPRIRKLSTGVKNTGRKGQEQVSDALRWYGLHAHYSGHSRNG